MTQPLPYEVFQSPEKFQSFLTAPRDEDFEGQHFDRKEASRIGSDGSPTNFPKLLDHVKECISAFANSNRIGGLLVLGISKTGDVVGVDHLPDKERCSLTQFNSLVGHSAEAKLVAYPDSSSGTKSLCLIYTPFSARALCETSSHHSKAWARHGAQNVLLNDTQRDQIRRDKGIVIFEDQICCPVEHNEIDADVLRQFRAGFLEGTDCDHLDDIALLYRAGAIRKNDGNYFFTNAGFLFFGLTPQRIFPNAKIRLLRFDGELAEAETSMQPNFDKDFDGALAKQIRAARTFFHESAFFKTFQKRAADGGFIEEPEYPRVAVDEAVVNAVVHRDYALQFPIEFRAYRESLRVANPGRLQQLDKDLPDDFTLEKTSLDSAPRNSHIMEWMRRMRDAQGSEFVKALSEGTKRMREEMERLGLPPPQYHIGHASTVLVLKNDLARRARPPEAETESTQFANLFPLRLRSSKGPVDPDYILLREAMSAIQQSLLTHQWFIDRFHHGRVTAHLRGDQIQLPADVVSIMRMFPAYVFQIRRYFGRLYLCCDFTLEVKNVVNLAALHERLPASQLIGKMSIARIRDTWERARISAIVDGFAELFLVDLKLGETVPCRDVIPDLPIAIIESLLRSAGVSFNLHVAIRQHSLAQDRVASRKRLQRTQNTIHNLATTIFPLNLTRVTLELDENAVALHSHSSNEKWKVDTLPEPSVEFRAHHADPNIRDGITKFGAYSDDRKDVDVVPVCASQYREQMKGLLERLRSGKFKYRGSERTFGVRFNYHSVCTVDSQEDCVKECARLIDEHSEWRADPTLSRIFLVHTPEEGYALDDPTAPYYRVKRLMLASGIPCQMVDSPTLRDPDYKDLNLALNLAAKVGIVPWVLPDAIPDADVFIGLSYTSPRGQSRSRLMGYANVFNEFGRWQFYNGSTEPFVFEKRTEYFRNLTGETLAQIQLGPSPNVYFHYSAKFSRDDRQAILEAARALRPNGIYHFVWINSHHSVRLYDCRPETDGSLPRGSFVATSGNQLYLSTTGWNPYRKSLGTPHPLEVNVWSEGPTGRLQPDLRSLAMQVLSLTKLNWASTDSLCAEPITTKYARDIAYLTEAFMESNPTGFSLNPVLERTPWFI